MRLRLSKEPLLRFVCLALIVGSYLRMHEQSDRTNQPVLPLVSDNHCDALHLLLVVLYEPRRFSKAETFSQLLQRRNTAEVVSS